MEQNYYKSAAIELSNAIAYLSCELVQSDPDKLAQKLYYKCQDAVNVMSGRDIYELGDGEGLSNLAMDSGNLPSSFFDAFLELNIVCDAIEIEFQDVEDTKAVAELFKCCCKYIYQYEEMR